MSNVIDITEILKARREQREFNEAFDTFLDQRALVEEHGAAFFEVQEQIEFSLEDALNDWFSRK